MRMFPRRLTLLLIVLFIATRLFVWINKPLEFTEIIYSYMPYAHLWASGTRPYLDQWYEYPPLTIPLFYIPHWIDVVTRHSLWHINYGQAYRGILLMIDVGIFALIWKTLNYWKVSRNIKLTSLIYYCLITAKANHFLYDTMDLAFAGAIALSVSAPIFVSTKKSQLNDWVASTQVWLGYWMAVALKLLNGPLGLPLILLSRRKLKRDILVMLAMFGLIWGIPGLIYRSSLQVILVYQQIRGLQIDSLGAIVVRTIDRFSHSERVIEVYKNYEIAGPLTDRALSIIGVVFPLSIVIFIAFSSWQAWRLADQKKAELMRFSLTLGYILMLMLVSKVLSRPFVLWHIPLLAMLPFENWGQQLKFLIPSLAIVIVTLSATPIFAIGPIDSPLLVGIIRSLSFILLFGLWGKWHWQLLQKK